MKLFFLVALQLLTGQVAFSQQELHVLVSIDDITGASYNISNSFLVIGKDTISLKYEVGRFTISEKDIANLKSIDKKEMISLNIEYVTFCPEQKTYKYNLNLDVELLLQEYLILKVYNHESYPGVFSKNESYGFECTSPLKSIGIAKNKKMKRNQCPD